MFSRHLRAAAGALALTLAAAPALAGDVTAFPGAEGAGRLSLGGRSGAVLRVTNLNDSGPGSLRAAVEAKGPRTVVFDVAGTIPLKSPLKISNPRITIAGQTAPGGGITLRDQTLVIGADDVVIRFIRSRLGAESKVEGDAIWISGGRRIILDHVSASWSVDETLSASARYTEAGQGFHDLTVQWSIIAESLARSIHVKGDHGYGSLIRGGQGSKISFHHNLWANHIARMPRPGNYDGPDKDPIGPLFDFRSNVFYNWGKGYAGYNADKATRATYNFVDNAYVPGPDTGKRVIFQESNLEAKGYFAGNSMDGVVPADPWSLVTFTITEPAGYRLAAPLDVAPVTPESADKAYERVLADAGASVWRDPVDRRIVEGVRSRQGKVINTQADVGGWPELPVGKALPDTDGDGMPDAWEKTRGLNPKSPDGAILAKDGSGWTNLELYLADAAKVRG
ncbi:pectate lyase [Caulobacter vibrioides]|uniref:pectate lyase n=1 Tax=Caulobacter vibrioides TaxID=155892 RepID=UPI000BB460A7|nr:pectate lyase [Caulobacter vibrioides]ATC26038.1 pectate lyase [Caulobacter vibrioides]PLR16839.1 pectate lyase [Caulobacter vibrioides]